MQLQADVLGMPIAVFEDHEATARGVGLFAGIARSVWSPVDLPPTEPSAKAYFPRDENSRRLGDRYEKWNDLFRRRIEGCDG